MYVQENRSKECVFGFVQPLTCWYLSPHAGHMTDLIYTEKELVQSLRDYISAEESKLAAVKRLAPPSSPSPLNKLVK